jgi:hypothetical protein
MKRRLILSAATATVVAPIGMLTRPAIAADGDKAKFKRIPTQFIAALGDPGANSGVGAQTWGLWPVDPGPRGVRLSQFAQLQKAGGVARDGWKFDNKDWWLEEHGLLMERPEFPVNAGRFLVTGNRSVTTSLTIHPIDKSGTQRWELGDGATLHDVTHLGCRAARYGPKEGDGTCSPVNAPRNAFPVEPGGAMPPVAGCAQQDYAVLIVIGVAPKA